MPTQAERISSLEAIINSKGGLVEKVDEIHSDVKTLLAAHNRQSGAAKLAAVIWGGLLALGGAIGGIFAARGH